MVLQFGSFRLNPETFELFGPDGPVALEPQVFQVLCHLIQHRDRVVPKDEILLAVWGDTFVNEATLSGRIMAARRAIGDSGNEQKWIKTIHGRGFRFVGDVREGGEGIGDQLARASAALESAKPSEALAILHDVRPELDRSDEMDAEQADWHRLYAQCLLLQDGWNSEQARDHYLESIRLAEGVGAVEVFRSARYHLATMLEVQGDYRGSETLMTAAVTDAESPDTEALELLACSLFHQGRFRECVDRASLGADAEPEASERRLSAFYGENPSVSCNYWLALSLWFLGDEEAALRHASRALRLSEQPGQIYCLAHARQQAAILQHVRRDAALCEHWATAAQSIGRRQSLKYREAVATILLGWARGIVGDHAQELPAMLEALKDVERLGAKMELPYFLAVVAELEAPDKALARLDEALGLCESGRGFFYRAEIMRQRALALRALGDSKWKEALRDALDSAQAQGAIAIVKRCEANLDE